MIHVYLSLWIMETRPLTVSMLIFKPYEWSNQWLVTFSAPKTKALIFSSKPDKHENATVSLNNTLIDEVQSHKHLGITLSQNLKWTHIDDICT